MNYATDFSH